MIFDQQAEGDEQYADLWMCRHSTEEEAREAHELVVTRLREEGAGWLLPGDESPAELPRGQQP